MLEYCSGNFWTLKMYFYRLPAFYKAGIIPISFLARSKGQQTKHAHG